MMAATTLTGQLRAAYVQLGGFSGGFHESIF